MNINVNFIMSEFINMIMQCNMEIEVITLTVIGHKETVVKLGEGRCGGWVR